MVEELLDGEGVGLGVSSVDVDALDHEGSLLRSEELVLVGEVDDEEGGDDTEADGEDTEEDEDPAPCEEGVSERR